MHVHLLLFFDNVSASGGSGGYQTVSPTFGGNNLVEIRNFNNVGSKYYWAPYGSVNTLKMSNINAVDWNVHFRGNLLFKHLIMDGVTQRRTDGYAAENMISFEPAGGTVESLSAMNSQFTFNRPGSNIISATFSGDKGSAITANDISDLTIENSVIKTFVVKNSGISTISSSSFTSSVDLGNSQKLTLVDSVFANTLKLTNLNTTEREDEENRSVITGTTFNNTVDMSNTPLSSTLVLLNCKGKNNIRFGQGQVYIDKGKFEGRPAVSGENIIVRTGTFRDNGGLSDVVADDESEATQIMNGSTTITTVKLSNPPIIIDWADFPG